VAVGATLLGLPLVLLGGSLLRHVGHVAPSTTNAGALRLRLLGHGVACDSPVAETPPAGGAASALTCAGPHGARLRLAAFRNPAARAAAARPEGLVVSGANWRVDVPLDARPLAERLARALTGRVG
jgi:hypothetical protein